MCTAYPLKTFFGLQMCGFKKSAPEEINAFLVYYTVNGKNSITVSITLSELYIFKHFRHSKGSFDEIVRIIQNSTILGSSLGLGLQICGFYGGLVREDPHQHQQKFSRIFCYLMKKVLNFYSHDFLYRMIFSWNVLNNFCRLAQYRTVHSDHYSYIWLCFFLLN